jgi:hypothetical protein
MDETPRLRNALIYGTKLAVSLYRTAMPQRRWPIITTSISGIAPEVWTQFKSKADERGLTFRLAMEEAIRNLAKKVAEGERQTWEIPGTDLYLAVDKSNLAGMFRLHTTTAKSHPIQMHYEVRDILQDVVKTTGYKKNIVILNAMAWWIVNTVEDHRPSPDDR